MTMSFPPEEGDIYTYKHRFTKEDVHQFAENFENQQIVHISPDEKGRLVVPDSLKLTLVTEVGAGLNYIERTTKFDFLRPVYTRDPIRCKRTIESAEQQAGRYNLFSSVVCYNEDEQKVIEAHTDGVLWKDHQSEPM